MTEKCRYCYVLDNGKPTFYDLNKKDILQMYQVEDLLNEQDKQISEQAIQLDYLKAENSHMRVVLEENKRLKAQLYCENEDGVCLICNNHYLVKGKTYDKYYISKCKKDHDECSTEILRYCKDFELKGD